MRLKSAVEQIIIKMTQKEFIRYLGMNGISIFSFASEEEFLEELGWA